MEKQNVYRLIPQLIYGASLFLLLFSGLTAGYAEFEERSREKEIFEIVEKHM